MKVGDRHYRSLWAEPDRGRVHVIDQTRLPHEFEVKTLTTVEEAVEAIRAMRVRGAPLIGVAAAHGVALAVDRDASNASLDRAVAALRATRPTAVNLGWALDRMQDKLANVKPLKRAQAAWAEAQAIADEDVELNEAIGRHGLALIEREHAARRRRIEILTHCNAGWIATVDWGTALAPIYMAHDKGIPVHVWVDETRPRNQGLLTAWELRQHGVPHTLVTDNAGGHLMQHGKVDMVFVGADRVTRRGDVCNKIGTYLKALAARDNDVPFYAAVPTPTIDWKIEDAHRDIPIEERAAGEVRAVRGLDAHGMPVEVAIVGDETAVSNPGFDVTPAKLVTGLITEKGIVRANERDLLEIWPRSQESKAYVT
ncbi:S-methyl-5-thioribose-1-phosphate isomerase [Usitatibacter palustris]|uniref:Methylthioribose-1-phosphate isomerase n=1 Tax=Usitatibacter palustris TaxID=2732487 RepID=A0A6M4HB18_9PROT|nr:S-methyl-5-thioribose-1-phosphate isomerase [Usitatibacter palustris]QJR16038.1 Methylthioribose-1-phosphate isomerase [Usitatibacter palustris]